MYVPYPTMDEVNAADRYAVCRWWRFLKSPDTSEQVAIMDRIAFRYKELGGFTPEISKDLGCGE